MSRTSTILQAGVVAALAATIPSVDAKAPEAASVRAAREVVLDEKIVGKAIEIRTARNMLTTVEFPEDMVGAPACGDCTDGKDPDSDSLFRVEPVARGRYLAITPISDPSRKGNSAD